MINQKSNRFQNFAMQFVTALIIFSWLSFLSVVTFSEENINNLTQEQKNEKKPWLKYPNGGKLTAEDSKKAIGAEQNKAQNSKVGE